MVVPGRQLFVTAWCARAPARVISSTLQEVLAVWARPSLGLCMPQAAPGRVSVWALLSMPTLPWPQPAPWSVYPPLPGRLQAGRAALAHWLHRQGIAEEVMCSDTVREGVHVVNWSCSWFVYHRTPQERRRLLCPPVAVGLPSLSQWRW